MPPPGARNPVPEQMRQLHVNIADPDPRQESFAFGLWTDGIILEVIHKRFSLALSEVSVGRMLK